MKKRIIALTLTALLALSSTSAFAATTNCTTVNYNNLLRNYTGQNTTVNTQYRVTVNGKQVNLNNIDWKTVLSQYTPAAKPVAPVEKPATPAPAPAPAPKPVAPAPAPKPAYPVSAPVA